MDCPEESGWKQKKTHPAYGLSGGHVIVACQRNIILQQGPLRTKSIKLIKEFLIMEESHIKYANQYK